MGTSSSNQRRQNNNNNYTQHPHSSSHQLNPPSNSTTTTSIPNYTPPPPPPTTFYSFSYHSNGYNNPSSNYGNQMIASGRSNYPPYSGYNQVNGWGNVRPAAVVLPPQPPANPAPYVERQNAKNLRNDVNVHKDTLMVEVDEQNPDQLLVSFVYDAVFDGSITLYYFAKEEAECKFVPLFPEAYMPVRIPFHKGHAHKFRQPSGTGVDLGFFVLDDLAKPSPEDVFPLVIVAETCLTGATNKSPNMQITQAVLEKSNSDSFRVKVIRQILWLDEVRYELREIYGIGSSTSQYFDDIETGKECVICMTEPKDTAVLPCRHMCMCGECAKELRLRSDKCPICRQPIEELMEIKINN